MPNARTQHSNAWLTPGGRRKMVDSVIVHGWTIEAAAERFQVDAKTVTKWRDRFLGEGPDGLFDRSSRPHTSPNRTPEDCRRRIVEQLVSLTAVRIFRWANGDAAVDTDGHQMRAAATHGIGLVLAGSASHDGRERVLPHVNEARTALLGGTDT